MGPLDEERDVVANSNGLGSGLDAVGEIERDERSTNGQALRRKSGRNLYGEQREAEERQHQERAILRPPRHHDVIRVCQLPSKYEEITVWHGRTTTVRHRVRCLPGPHDHPSGPVRLEANDRLTPDTPRPPRRGIARRTPRTLHRNRTGGICHRTG